jgi:dTDP-4-dehydrorhamnose reductase
MPEVNAISSAQYPTAARRPAYSVLNNEYLAQYFALRPQPWQAALTDVLDEFASIK